MDLELSGKRCLVSGASRGIGRAIARGLAAEGAVVAAVARGQADLDALIAELGGAPHVAIVADVTTPEGASAAVDGAVVALGGIDVVIANVGKSFGRTAQDLDDEDFTRSLDMNLWAAQRIASRSAPHLAASGGGAMTLISSVYGREAGGAPGYNVGKAGVIALAKALARDWAKVGVRVNSVAPGSIVFPGSGWDRRQQADPAGIAAFVERDIPAGRFGTPEEVAEVVVFLSSVRSRWITGACVVVDGGQSRAL